MRPESELAAGGIAYLGFAAFDLAPVGDWRIAPAALLFLIVGPYLLLRGSIDYFRQFEDDKRLWFGVGFVIYSFAFGCIQIVVPSATPWTIGLGWWGMSIKWYVGTSILFLLPFIGYAFILRLRFLRRVGPD